MAETDDLQRGAIREARLADAITADFAADLGAVLRRLDMRMRQLLRPLRTGADGRLVFDSVNLARVVQMRSDISAALTEAGYGALAQAATDEALDPLAAQVLSTARGAQQAAALTALDVDALVALKQLRQTELLVSGQQAADRLWRTVLDGVLGNRPVTDLVQDLADTAERSFKQARVLYDTAVSTYSRQAALLHTTGEANERFVYVGPFDIATRPFCRKYVGQVLPRTEIDQLENGQLPNTLLTGGGYNCRHRWARVSRLAEAA